MSGEKIQRYSIRAAMLDTGIGHQATADKCDGGRYMLSTDVLADLASRDAEIQRLKEFGAQETGIARLRGLELMEKDATIKTQGEEIAELRASVERLSAACRLVVEAHPVNGNLTCKCCIASRAAEAALAPGVKSARELEWRVGGNVWAVGYAIHNDTNGVTYAILNGKEVVAKSAPTLRAAMLACERHAASVPQDQEAEGGI